MMNHGEADLERNVLEAAADFRRRFYEKSVLRNKVVDRESQFDFLRLGNGSKGIYSMDPSISPVNNNCLVMGGTGGGKTKSVVEPYLLHTWFQSLVVLLTKRRLREQYGSLLRRRGYIIKTLDLAHPEKSDIGFDPMQHIRNDSDLALLGKSILTCTGDTSERDVYWQNSAASLFCALAKLAIHQKGRKATMNDVLYLLRHIDVETREIYDEDLGETVRVSDCCPKEDIESLRDTDPKMYSDWCQYKENADATVACIRGELLTAINTLMLTSQDFLTQNCHFETERQI